MKTMVWRCGRGARREIGPRSRAFAIAVLLAALSAGQALAQQRTITGRVTDAANGQPLIGAEVALALGGGAVAAEGRSGVATFTSGDGAFTIEVPAGEVTLTIRMLGYKQVDVAVPANQNSVDIELETDPLRLDEIVVTGQATGVQRRNLANAVATVSADEINIVPTASIEGQLYGKVAGADIQSNSGAPGGGNQISMRGVNTILGNSTPLYVVDGVVVSDATIQSGVNSVTGSGGGIANMQDNGVNRIADLNPADIANIEILKGASAAAIYGSQANNGVILITTKSGQPGETQFNLSQRFGLSTLAKKIGTRTFTEAEAVDVFGPSAADVFTGDTYDLEEQLAGDAAPAWETSLSISGGSDRTRYYVSGLAHNEEGIITGTFYD
ncbi:MAG: TonB-dependent receptor plug domain-containing protein, partial [Longimicrobiales bacterium]